MAPSAIPEPILRQPCRTLATGEIEEMVEKFTQGAGALRRQVAMRSSFTERTVT